MPMVRLCHSQPRRMSYSSETWRSALSRAPSSLSNALGGDSANVQFCHELNEWLHCTRINKWRRPRVTLGPSTGVTSSLPPTWHTLFKVLSVTPLSAHSHGFSPYSQLD